MELIKLRCDNCGSNLEMDMEHLLVFCPFCGQKLMIDFDQVGSVMKDKETTKRHLYSENQETKRIQMSYENEKDKRKSEHRKGIIESLIILLPLGIFGFFAVIGSVKSEKKGKEVQDYLQNIEIEMESAMHAEDYETALLKANQLHCDDCAAAKKEAWDTKREAYIELIRNKVREKEIQNPDNIIVGVSSESLKGKNYQEVMDLFRKLGFLSVTAQVSSIKPGWFQNNKVEHILIGGKTDSPFSP